MRLLPKSFSTLISLWIIFLAGCGSTSFLPVGMVELPMLRLPVEENVEKMTFKTEWKTPRGMFSGLMVIKKVPGDAIRLAFFSEVGMSYMEGSLAGEYPYELVLRSVNPLLHTKHTASDLETALNLLLVGRDDLREGGVFTDKAKKYWIAGDAADGSRYWARLDNEGRFDRAYFDRAGKVEAFFYYQDKEDLGSVEFFRKGEDFLSLSTLY